MAFSVNTNRSAFIALQNLHQTNKDLQRVQTRINTGLKVSSAKDDAATYAIAQRLRGDVAGLSAVTGSIKRASSSLDVAIAAAEAVSDLLIEMKQKAVAAKDSGLDTASRQSLSRDFAQLRDQITSIIENAEFNGVNAVKANGRSISAITDPTASKSLNIAAQDLSLGGSNISISAGQEIDDVASASLVVDQLTSAIDNVNAALSTFGAGAKRLEIQQSFVNKLSDTIEIGIGNLVDADLAKEAANLQALQVKQQLGLQALSIANQSPSAILTLFR
jgi:flagellin